MDKETIETLKGMSRRQRLAFFNSHRDELSDTELDRVSGGDDWHNYNSDYIDSDGIYFTSWGYMCRGDRFCGGDA